MAEEERIEEQGAVEDTSQYLAAIKELKENTVSKDAYLKLKDENAQLLDSLINGGQVNMVQPKEEVDIQALRNKLADQDHDLTNLEFVKTALELRDAVISQGGMDPFLPMGHNVDITQDDIDKAENVANVFRECIDYADGDSQIFTQELMRRTKDAMPIMRTRR